MAFNVSSIAVFTNETAQALIKKAVLQGRTIDLVSVIPGIKYKESLNIMANTISPQNAVCGFSSNGSVAFSQRDITVTALEIKESLCQKTLEQYFMGQWMSAGEPKENELGSILAESYVEKIKEYNEIQLWIGQLTGSTFNTPITNSYTKIDGWLNQLTGATARIHPTAATGATSAGHIVTVVDAMVASIPSEMWSRNDLVLFLGYPAYVALVQALKAANNYHYTGEVGSDMTLVYPGTNVKIVATHGLDLIDYKVLTYGENLVVGTDLMNEEEKYDIWYSKDNDEVRTNIQWKIGAAIRFVEFCVCSF